MNVALIMPVHNGLVHLKRFLPAVENAINNASNDTEVRYSIIITDDGSTDGTSEWLKKNHPEIHIVKGNGDLWWSGGVTKGTKYAIENLKPDGILLWNNDILPHDSYFQRLSARIEKINNNVILGSTICDLSVPDKIWSMGGIFNPRTGKKYMLGLDKKPPANAYKDIEADWLTGMGTYIPSNVFQTIGYWNAKDFPQYFGDADFTYRAKKQGFKLIVDPTLILYNDTENSGMLHQGSYKKLIESFFSIRSKYNIQKEIKFYRMYATSPLPCFYLFGKYFRYVGGFFKWKILNLLNIHKMQA